MNYYISDWHYGHANCISFDGRPFVSCEQMNGELIKRWNQVITNRDSVFVLGDMFWCKGDEAVDVLEKLNGQKFLVKGNHDRCHDTKFVKQFASIKEYMEVEDEGRKVVLCHYPIPCFKNHCYGWYHLYGHVHTSFEHGMMMHDRYLFEQLYLKPCLMYNVGAMLPYMNYTPRTLDEILLAGEKYYKDHYNS